MRVARDGVEWSGIEWEVLNLNDVGKEGYPNLGTTQT